ncbi:MAG TPA: hypothetical protein VF295_05095 [Candidatus Limnocylindria bacterium]|jgi:hypothetical protein
MTAVIAAPPVAPDEWIVCCGEQRAVTNGQVACPAIGGRSIGVETCAECRMLSWRTDERERSTRCSTERGTER